ncbi:hypothetical protein [Paludisphaera soli]|uniref:hypothetical protein n=1 Tax=Paludisphaera soli TaxID=2712865 RepID=UPI0013EE03A3|nr:hypothetical protein [Paludisphaera soli]
MSTTTAPSVSLYTTPGHVDPALHGALAARLVEDVMDAVDEAAQKYPDVRIAARVVREIAGPMLAVDFASDPYSDTCRMFPAGLPGCIVRRDVLEQAESMNPKPTAPSA